MHHTTSKGDIGVARATADLIEKGWSVLTPVCAASPFDLAIYRRGEFKRIQVKYRSGHGGAIDVRARRTSITAKRAKSRANDEIDLICIYVPEKEACYYVPAGTKVTHLRLAPPRNAQKNGVRYVSEFTAI